MSIVREALAAEIKEMVQKSVQLAHKRDKSKTDHGKKLYTKKLVKNNQMLSQALEAFERLPSKEGTNTAAETENESAVPQSV